MKGYAGRILYVDLTSGSIEEQIPDQDFLRQHIGGLGISAQLFLDMIRDKPDFHPYDPENPVIIMTGPLTGFKINGTARWTVCSRSPLTGYLGDANVGGHFGARLKHAGYDGIVITGRSSTPVYLYIDNKEVALKDASPYWGMDTYDVTDQMVADLKPVSGRKGQVVAIGPAGENLVRFASIINNKRHAAGRTGLGAVWGSKKLKAIYVAGKGELEVAHPDRLQTLKQELQELYDDAIGIIALQSFGTAAHIDTGLDIGDIPIKNWNQTEWDQAELLTPTVIEEKIDAGNRTCYGCGVACKKEAEVKEGPFKMKKGPGPEYETIASFGFMCLNSSIESIAKANELCNRYGMDTISCGTTIAFAIECFENGLISVSDTEGIELAWGASEAVVAMCEKIGRKEGFGAVLAEGSLRAAQYLGGEAKQFLTTVKGLEAPMHDPRALHGLGLAYGISPRGACHEASLTFNVESGTTYIPDIPGFDDDLPEGTSEGRANLNIICQDYGMFFSHCAIFCNLGCMPLSAGHAVEMVNCITGFEYSLEEVLTIGRRLWLLKRGLTNLFGSRADDDRLPEKLMLPLPEGPTQGSIPDMDLMLTEFYAMRGLTNEGIPRSDVLVDNNLKELDKLLYPRES